MIKYFFVKKSYCLLMLIIFTSLVLSLAYNLKQFEINRVLQETSLLIYNEALLKNRECLYVFNNNLTKKNRDKIKRLEAYVKSLKERGFVE